MIREDSARKIIDSAGDVAVGVYGLARLMSEQIRSKGLLYALIVRLLIFPLVGFCIGYFFYSYKLGIVLALSFIWYEAVAAVVTFALALALALSIAFGIFLATWKIFEWVFFELGLFDWLLKLI